MLAAWERDGLYGKIRSVAKGRPGIHPDGRSAVRERRHPLGACGQQDPKGHHRQVAHVGWLRRAIRARLGLPRSADRDAGREDAWPGRAENRRQGISRGVPRIRLQASGCAAQGLQAPGRARRLGASVPDHGAALRGRAAARLRPDHQERTCVQGLQARALVPELPLGAGRGRGGVRGQDLAERVCALRGCRSRRSGAALRLAPEGSELDEGMPTSIAIWTTTPWTLPANRAVAVHPQFDYALVEFDFGGGRERLVLASELVEAGDARARRRDVFDHRRGQGRRARASDAAASLLRPHRCR